MTGRATRSTGVLRQVWSAGSWSCKLGGEVLGEDLVPGRTKSFNRPPPPSSDRRYLGVSPCSWGRLERRSPNDVEPLLLVELVRLRLLTRSASYGGLAMALFHKATITPTKAELIADWVPTRSWGPSTADSIEVVGSYRFDDPAGRVGMETHLVIAGDQLMQVPLTYRDEPLDGSDDALITKMHHSVLGTRWVYDGLRDPRLIVMLAGVTMTGQGEALGMADYHGRWYIAPSNVRIHGGGWTQERVPVDGFELESDDATASMLHNERFDLTMFRRPVPGPRPAIGLTATWDGQIDAVVLAEVCER